MKFSHKFMEYWIPVLLWMGAMFWFSTDLFSPVNTAGFFEPAFHSLIPGLSKAALGQVNIVIRKIAHMVEYFILGLLFFRAYRADSSSRWSRKWALFAVLSIVAYALTDEWHQSFVPSRTASLWDVGLDAVGGVLSQIFLKMHIRRPDRS